MKQMFQYEVQTTTSTEPFRYTEEHSYSYADAEIETALTKLNSHDLYVRIGGQIFQREHIIRVAVSAMI